MNMPDLGPALPEIFLLGAACVILIADLFVSDERRSVSFLLTLGALFGCAWITLATSRPEPVLTFSGSFIDDPMADVLKTVVYAAVAAMLVYSRPYLALRGMYRGEFLVLALFATLGMMVMISANSLLLLYLGLELLSLSLYAMVALRRDSASATEAAMKYFVLGALASGMLLYGMSMVYGATGTLDIQEIALQLAKQQLAGDRLLLAFGIVFLVVGIGFKLGAVPFHMWVPDVYEGAPTPVTMFIGSAPKLAAFALVIRLLAVALQEFVADWSAMLMILAVLSMAVGNLTAIVQTSIKRMLAYSTISHMGFLLLGVLAGTHDGYASAMFYVVVYVITSLAGFGLILVLSRDGFEADKIADFRGLNQRSPWHAFLMLLAMFSMAGVPPTVGFYAKFSVLYAIVQVGLVWLAVLSVIVSLIGAYYYLRIVKTMYFDDPTDQTPILPQPEVRLLASTNGLAIIALGILPQPLMAICAGAIRHSLY